MVLLLTHSEDFYTLDLVAESLRKKGLPSIRINLDSFPVGLRISKLLHGDGRRISFRNSEADVDTSKVKAVWLRKYWSPRISPDIDPDYQDGCYRESKEVLDIFLHALSDLPFIDRLETIRKSNNKFLQLEAAKAAGIRIPRTLITNDPQELQQFFDETGTEVVAKLLTQLSTSMNGNSFFMYTSKITRNDLEDADLLSGCPMTFQEYIQKAYELRIIYVDGNFYTGKIDSSASKLGQVDWRRSTPAEVSWETYELPAELKKQLTTLMQRMGLTYGAIDMIRSSDGEYVFLEVNPTGEWGMLQRDLGHPISDAIADALIKRIGK
jgi:MvdC family ATP-grasp ribosomal peptide maturase